MGRIIAAAIAASVCSCMVGDDPDDRVAGSSLSPDDTGDGSGFGILARTCAAGVTTPGIDVAYYQGTINWSRVAAAGYQFAFIRVSDGTTFHDPKFDSYWTGSKNAGLIRGAYQYFRPAQSATAQADLMISAIGTLGPGDLPPVIDVETAQGLSASTIAARVRTWVDRVHAATGIDPIIYTGKYFWRDQVGSPSSFATNPLWIAQYTSHCPDLPAPWGSWAFWQYSESGHVPGISGYVDMDKFNGSLADLQALANQTPNTPPASTCTSQTMGRDVDDGECVQAAADQRWYRCDAGAWTAVTSTSSCSHAYGWCDSSTLGRAVPPRTCVQSAVDDKWYQCDGSTWVTPVDPDSATGPAGVCSQSYQR